jgi:magnesium chelatase family protein
MGRPRQERLGFVHTATINGVEALPVTVEVNVGQGLPGISIVGMPDLAVQEARHRVRLALRAAGFEVPNMHVVVNLAPSSLKKAGSGFDLPIALGMLLATGQIPADYVKERLCVGELSLDGSLRPVRGLLAYERLAHDQGLGLLSASVERGVFSAAEQEHVCLVNLMDLRLGRFSAPKPSDLGQPDIQVDFAEIAGNDLPKRALQIAAAGWHPLLMVGPPGSGKSMLAGRLSTILPALSEEERIESAMIHSVAGLPYNDILCGNRPFRAPHHAASRAGLLGGGSPPLPGEVTLAHNGVLFLDEMPEFGGGVLQLLRQPVEQGRVPLARASGTTIFPARFMLVAAANPCPCGYLGDPQHGCRCTPAQISHYQGRIGGPLMDRFDLVVDVWRSDPAHVLDTGKGSSSRQLREGVLAARDFACWRRQRRPGREPEAPPPPEQPDMAAAADDPKGSGEQLLAECLLGKRERASLEALARRHQLSGRGIMRTLAVARTIADLAQSEKVIEDHLLEAVTYRSKEVGAV